MMVKCHRLVDWCIRCLGFIVPSSLQARYLIVGSLEKSLLRLWTILLAAVCCQLRQFWWARTLWKRSNWLFILSGYFFWIIECVEGCGSFRIMLIFWCDSLLIFIRLDTVADATDESSLCGCDYICSVRLDVICCKRKILMADVDLVWEKNIAGLLTGQSKLYLLPPWINYSC